MTDSVFLNGMKHLEAAFRAQPLSPASLKIYYEKLKGADDETFQNAVEQCTEEENFFPSIACLLKHCGLEPRFDAAGRRLANMSERNIPDFETIMNEPWQK